MGSAMAVARYGGLSSDPGPEVPETARSRHSDGLQPNSKKNKVGEMPSLCFGCRHVPGTGAIRSMPRESQATLVSVCPVLSWGSQVCLLQDSLASRQTLGRV